MGDDLASRFAAERTNRIEWDGPLYSLYELSTHPRRLLITFVSSRSSPPQGVRMKIRGGTLTANGREGEDVVLWQDTAPTDVAVSVRWTRSDERSLRVWNVWRVGDVMHAWIANAGMRVETIDESMITLRCSDGEGEADFADLVVQLIASR